MINLKRKGLINHSKWKEKHTSEIIKIIYSQWYSHYNAVMFFWSNSIGKNLQIYVKWVVSRKTCCPNLLRDRKKWLNSHTENTSYLNTVANVSIITKEPGTWTGGRAGKGMGWLSGFSSALTVMSLRENTGSNMTTCWHTLLWKG
jgi:hypothetical protein